MSNIRLYDEKHHVIGVQSMDSIPDVLTFASIEEMNSTSANDGTIAVTGTGTAMKSYEDMGAIDKTCPLAPLSEEAASGGQVDFIDYSKSLNNGLYPYLNRTIPIGEIEIQGTHAAFAFGQEQKMVGEETDPVITLWVWLGEPDTPSYMEQGVSLWNCTNSTWDQSGAMMFNIFLALQSDTSWFTNFMTELRSRSTGDDTETINAIIESFAEAFMGQAITNDVFISANGQWTKVTKGLTDEPFVITATSVNTAQTQTDGFVTLFSSETTREIESAMGRGQAVYIRIPLALNNYGIQYYGGEETPPLKPFMDFSPRGFKPIYMFIDEYRKLFQVELKDGGAPSHLVELEIQPIEPFE